ncbi:DUF1430 domain-containing protein [Salsuginibacillus kocurii]|uniref:DUF1430 domain-containing protein n=1 Tax=Salsuginibacillus kocurii TaxID=427078 RepID=UPI00035D4089|nr:DUF1430 domain-containing protein [Salsuginibacillus kocurii]
MNKIIYCLLGTVFILINIFGFNLFNEKLSYNILYNDSDILTVDFNGNENLNIEDIQRFSEKEEVNISQYNFFTEDRVNIYSTNLNIDPNLHIHEGSLPHDSEYISNINNYSTEQSGVITFPLTNMEVRYYNYQDIVNVGVDNRFYINGDTSPESLERVKEFFSQYGEVSFVNDQVSLLQLLNFPLLLISFLSLVLYVIGLFFFLIQNRKMYILLNLWGSSNVRIILVTIKLLIKPICIIFSALFATLLIIILYLNQTEYLLSYLSTFLAFNMFIITAIITLTVMVSASLISMINMNTIKGDFPFRKVHWVAVATKVTTSLIFFTMIGFSINSFLDLNEKLDSFDYWNEAQDIYRLQLTAGIEYLEENLEQDRDFNNRMDRLYKQLESEHNAFLMGSENFYPLDNDTESEPEYIYTLNAGEEEFYLSSGRRVTINENYLNYNPIEDVNGDSVVSQLTSDSNTLDILVPEQFSNLENEILDEYLDYFYFQKVEVDDIYNEELNEPLNDTSVQDLSINIIYTEEGQDYFTYKSNTGDNQNNITDPIAIVYDNNFDNSYISALSSTSLYFEDYSSGNAFNNIEPYLMDIGVPEVGSVTSVFNEASDEIVEHSRLLLQQLIGLIVIFTFIIIFLSLYIWTYVAINMKKLNLKYILGYSFFNRNKHLLLISFLTTIIIGLLSSLIHDILLIIPIAFLFFAIEFLIIYGLSTNFVKKNINKVLKGDYL